MDRNGKGSGPDRVRSQSFCISGQNIVEAALSPPLHRAQRTANLPCDAVVFCPRLFLAVSISYLMVGGFPFALSIAQRQQFLSAKEDR